MLLIGISHYQSSGGRGGGGVLGGSHGFKGAQLEDQSSPME